MYDWIVIGGGLYGLYSTLYCARKGMKVLCLEMDDAPFKRATYINQARVHMGYHYPRSLTTALKSAGYFKRFNEDFGFCIYKSFDQVYATSQDFSWTDALQFMDFCRASGIRCDEIAVEKYFNRGMCDGAFLTEEYTYDAHVLRDYYLDEIKKFPNAELIFGQAVKRVIKDGDDYLVVCNETKNRNASDKEYRAVSVLNSTYASVNQILREGFSKDSFKIKYELCEIILTKASEKLEGVGITVMDGPFFSIMPFGMTGMHSLTSVTFTPHVVSFDELPTFSCQEGTNCSPQSLANCNDCMNRPQSAWPYMSHLADKYLRPEYGYKYIKSLYSMKPILKSSEVDDSRPTAIRVHEYSKGKPSFISVLSGKINTVYDLDEYLN